MHRDPNVVDWRTSCHLAAGCGGFQRSGPTGGAAKGMPRYSRAWPSALTLPCTLPVSILTTRGLPACACRPNTSAVKLNAAYRTRNLRLMKILRPQSTRGSGIYWDRCYTQNRIATMLLYLIVVSGSYLLGSIPFGFLLVWLVRKEDIRTTGSGNIGATNVLRSGSKKLGLLTFALDGAKGYAAVAVADFLARNQAPAILRDLAILAGLFVILGHMFPVWLRFKGGKGVATAFGVFLALCPLAALSALALWLVIVALTRYVSLASILAAVVLPFLTLWLSPGRYGYVSGAAVFVSCWMVIAKHRQNIVRLLQGTEHRFGAAKKTGKTEKTGA